MNPQPTPFVVPVAIAGLVARADTRSQGPIESHSTNGRDTVFDDVERLENMG
jgi:hypothetical protein